MSTRSRFRIDSGAWRLMLISAIAIVAIGCNSGESEKHSPAAEQAIRDAADAWNGKRIDDFVAAFTDAGLAKSFGDGTTREDIGSSLNEFIGEPPLDIQE